MKDKGLIKLMIAGDSISQITGLSYISSSFMTLFNNTAKFDISYMTISGKDSTYEGMEIHGKRFQSMFKDINKYNCQVKGKNYYSDIDKAIETEKPDIVFTVHDPWIVDGLAYSSYRESFTLINYVTIEVPVYPERVMQPSPIAPGQRKSIKDILQRADLVIPVTNMGANAIKKFDVDVTEPVPNGIHYNLRIVDNVSKIDVFGKSVSEDDFIFMSMGQNTERKRLDRVVEAFKKFWDKMGKQQKYRLYLHTNMADTAGGTDLKEMINTLGISDQVLVSTSIKSGKGIPKNDLYRRYKACDCYIGLPSGEGWGLGGVEAMMHGLPIVYIDYGGHAEYCSRVGIPVKVKDYLPARNAYMLWALADTDDAARAMARIVSDKNLREKLGKKAIEIVRDEFDWEVVFKKLLPLVEGAIERTKASSFSGIPLRRIV